MRQQRYTIRTTVNNGRVADVDRHAMLTVLSNFEGKEVDISVQRAQNKRSLEQNGYYFKVIVPVLQRAVYEMWGDDISKDDAHEILKQRFSKIERFHVATGELISIPVSTTTNGTMDQEDYHTKCRAWIEETFGYRVPLPNENIEIEDAHTERF